MVANVKVYVLPWCGYCHATRRLLKKKNIEPEVIDVTGNDELRSWLASVTGSNTLPQTFIGDRAVGGHSDLVALDKSGDLGPLLAGGA
jgi:glutaredoxin 3